MRIAPRILLVGLCGLLTWVSVDAGALAQTPPTGAPTKIDVSKMGPQVGQVVPGFRLSDQNGKVWTRASIMGPKGALLLFYRSADWCPYSRGSCTTG